MSAPNFAWDGYTDADGISSSFIEPTFDNPRRVHTPNDDRGPRLPMDPPKRSPEQVLAAEVLLKAWNDATGRTYLDDCSKVSRALRTEAWAFLTAEMPDARAARRQLFTGLLGVDDDFFRAAAARQLGQCSSLHPEFDPYKAKKDQLMWVAPPRPSAKPARKGGVVTRRIVKPQPSDESKRPFAPEPVPAPEPVSPPEPPKPKPKRRPKKKRKTGSKGPGRPRKNTKPPIRYKFYQSLLRPLLAEARQRRDTHRRPEPIDNTVLRHVGESQNELPPTDPNPCADGTRIAQVLGLLEAHPDGLSITELQERLPTFSRTRITNSVFYLRRNLGQPIVMKYNRYRLLPRAEWVAETNSPTAGT